MKMYEIAEMSEEEIVKRIKEEENNLVDLKFQHELKNLTNTSKLKSVKRHCKNENSLKRKTTKSIRKK